MVLELTLLPLFVDKTRKYRYVSGDLYARHCVRFFTNVISCLHNIGYYSPHFTDEKIEAQKGSLNCPRTHSKQVAELGFELGNSSLKFSLPLPAGLG